MRNKIVDEVLMHHGIKGQKWGVRNGPPYPLKAGDHSASERRANWRSSLAGAKSGASSSDPGINGIKVLKDAERVLSERNIDYAELEKLESKMETVQKRTNALRAIVNPIGIGVASVAKAKGKAREKSALNSRKGLEVDKKTGLYLKKNQNSTMREDAKRTNPRYSLFTESITPARNCVLCTATYDLRRRGYEVIARQTHFGRHFENTIERWYKGAKEEKIPISQEMGAIGLKMSQKEIEGAISSSMSKLPDGSRGAVFISQGKYGINHAVAFEKENGSVRFPDGQNGSVYPPSTLASVIKRGGGNLSYWRLDNIEPDYEAMKKEAVL